MAIFKTNGFGLYLLLSNIVFAKENDSAPFKENNFSLISS